LTISGHEEENLRLEAISRLVEASERIRPAGRNRQELAGWLERLLRQHEYVLQGKAAPGAVRRNIAKMTGSSLVEPGRARSCPVEPGRARSSPVVPGRARVELTRLIARYAASGRIQPAGYDRRSFAQPYARADIELPAAVEQAQETLGGPRTRRIQERAIEQFGKQRYVQLATISLAQLNSLRGSQRYGERRKPEPQAQPGDLRVDTVHQGDQPGGGGRPGE
jgi:hypothetical protein